VAPATLEQLRCQENQMIALLTKCGRGWRPSWNKIGGAPADQ
jgi:hypothetical protein